MSLKGADVATFVLRDYADPANTRTVCEFQDDVVQLIDARHVVIEACVEDCRSAVVDLPEVTYHWFVLPREPDVTTAEFGAVAPDLGELTWMSSNAVGEQRKLHHTRADGDHEVANLRPQYGRCGSPEDSKPADYQRSGAFSYVLDVPIANDSVFLVLHGDDVVFQRRPHSGESWAEGANPTFPVWSPVEDRVFFQQGGDVWQWAPGEGLTKLLPGVRWMYPTISADGQNVAYAVQRDDGFHDVYVFNFADDSRGLIGHQRSQPSFITDTQVWYVSEAQGVCGVGADERLIYDLDEGTEAPSIIDYVAHIWPATSSNT